MLSQNNKSLYAEKSVYGRGIASIASSFNELGHMPKYFNPLEYLNKTKYFLGLNHITNDPVYSDESFNTKIVGMTRCGKGILITLKIIEAMRNGMSIISIDPKEDEYQISAIKQELKRQNRPGEDLIILNWPNDFGLIVFSKTDTVEDALIKLSILLSLEENDNELGASFYRKQERIILSKVLYIFFNTQDLLNIDLELTIPNLSIFLKYIISDLISTNEYKKELEKNKPNFDKVEQLSKRYFDPELFAKLDFSFSNLQSLESLQFSLSEFDNISIYNKHDIKEALLNGKVIYIKSDMLSASALKFLRLILASIVIDAKKFKEQTNCLVVLDEFSTYPIQLVGLALATLIGFNVKFIIAYQSEGQMIDENLRISINDNCSQKIYYKSSDIKTLQYIQEISGLELVSQKIKKSNEVTIRQIQEPHMNITRLRALPRARVAILIDENLNELKVFQTSPVPVNEPFDWEIINCRKVNIKKLHLNKIFSTNMEEISSNENSDIFKVQV